MLDGISIKLRQELTPNIVSSSKLKPSSILTLDRSITNENQTNSVKYDRISPKRWNSSAIQL